MYTKKLDREMAVRGWTTGLPPDVLLDALDPAAAETALSAALAIGAVRRHLDAAEEIAVRRARRSGATWEALGWRLGRWPSTTWRSFHHPEETPDD